MKTRISHNSAKNQAQTELLELWWVCAELARFLATTDEKGFRQLWRKGKRYVDGILARIRTRKSKAQDLEDAECFLECEGWGWAEKLWITGEGEEGFALEAARLYFLEDSCMERHIGQEGLFAWRCGAFSRSFDGHGLAVAEKNGFHYPPSIIKNEFVRTFLQILEKMDDTGQIEDKRYKWVPPSKTSDSKSGTMDEGADAKHKAKKSRSRGKSIPSKVKQDLWEWVQEEYGGDVRGVGWKKAFDIMSNSSIWVPPISTHCTSSQKFKHIVEAARKSEKRRRAITRGQKR